MGRFSINAFALPLLLGLALLTACTGSSEEPTRALLVAGINTPGSNTYQIRFFQSSTLQPGNFDQPRRVGSWDLDEPIVTLLYRRSLQEGVNDQLWVLTQNRLRRYNASNLSVEDVGTPQLDGFDQATGVDCSRGYLRQGQSNVLLVCPPAPATPPRPIEEYRAWIIPFTATALPSPIDFTNPNLVRLSAPVQLTLGQNDQLLYLTPAQFGQYDFVNPFIERPLSLTASPTDLIFVNGLGLGLFDDNDPTTTDTTLVSWNLSATSEVGLVQNSNIAARLFARGAPPVFVLGTGLARFEGNLQLPRETESGLLRTRRYSTATVGIDQFLYIADLDSPTLLVIDLTVNIASALTSAGVRTSSLGSFQERITSLAFIPVE
ncbi:hypothetical protein [Meiothermus hypogaeus]|uniref:Lipoprotein n=2 Tax=Meiothermus hypogaeus TaxID=884155 RepID=A0A511QZA6_9DEIN|nr:hypothetical protein [Meiothermus hypogaeus]RIH77425.1 hypothetical protein Mhypo_02037 [Meiothermus hypogaeus]GEM82367.1 hypothetical protein MHY01S_05330 [Meiothermus hypogaeus NBRC 106114]